MTNRNWYRTRPGAQAVSGAENPGARWLVFGTVWGRKYFDGSGLVVIQWPNEKSGDWSAEVFSI